MRRLSMTLMIAAVLAATPALADGEASEVRQSGGLLDASAHRRPMMISLFAGVPHAYWYYAGFPFGVGGRFLIPLAHDGFIPRVNDEFDIEFGVSGYYCYYGACRTGVGVGAQPIGNVGLIFMATKTIALRLEAGYPWVKAGIGFAF